MDMNFPICYECCIGVICSALLLFVEGGIPDHLLYYFTTSAKICLQLPECCLLWHHNFYCYLSICLFELGGKNSLHEAKIKKNMGMSTMYLETSKRGKLFPCTGSSTLAIHNGLKVQKNNDSIIG